MRKTTGRRGEGAFTLIELLVVIAIVAILLTIALPGLRSAKETARQVVCATQMKQWALATLAYTQEHNDTIPVYSDVCDVTKGENAMDPKTVWYNRLSVYMTREDQGTWGMDHDLRRCPSARAKWGENAVWVGVYYGKYNSENAPFIQPFRWTGTEMVRMTYPVRYSSIKSPFQYLMMLDVRRDAVFDPFYWSWDTDYTGDGMNDSNSGVLAATGLGPFNSARPRIHRGGSNVALFDGHVEWIRYDTFWQIGGDGYPIHSYWYNNNRP